MMSQPASPLEADLSSTSSCMLSSSAKAAARVSGHVARLGDQVRAVLRHELHLQLVPAQPLTAREHAQTRHGVMLRCQDERKAGVRGKGGTGSLPRAAA